MKTIGRLRWSWVVVFAMGMVVFFASCSKKDVVQDEPVINPSLEGEGAVLWRKGRRYTFTNL
jgi:hypothetical protein